MQYFDSFQFALRLITSWFNPAAWALAAAMFLISFFAVGLFWGMAWNKKWGFFGHLPSMVFSLLVALTLSAATLARFGANQSLAWIENQRTSLTKGLNNSGSLNRQILRSAWDNLQPLGGQDGLTPPPAGNEIRLNSDEEARVLAEVGASEVKRPLSTQGPFRFGTSLNVRDPKVVADEVLRAITAPVYPITVSPENAWSKAAITNQVTNALDSTLKILKQPMEELAKALLILQITLFLVHAGLIARASYNDINTNPKV